MYTFFNICTFGLVGMIYWMLGEVPPSGVKKDEKRVRHYEARYTLTPEHLLKHTPNSYKKMMRVLFPIESERDMGETFITRRFGGFVFPASDRQYEAGMGYMESGLLHMHATSEKFVFFEGNWSRAQGTCFCKSCCEAVPLFDGVCDYCESGDVISFEMIDSDKDVDKLIDRVEKLKEERKDRMLDDPLDLRASF